MVMKKEECLIIPESESSFSLDKCKEDLEKIVSTERIHIDLDIQNKKCLFKFGMLFAYQHYFRSQKEIILTKKIQETEVKSFNNVLLYLINKGEELLEPYQINTKKAFMISPVRSTTDSLALDLRNYKSLLLEKGLYDIVHYPLEDTNQNDSGPGICKENLQAESTSGSILIWYKHDSFGSAFDLGMDFMLKHYLDWEFDKEKKRHFSLINKEDVKIENNGYEKFLLDIVKNEN